MIDYEILKKCDLFRGMDDGEIQDIVTNLDGIIRTADKNTLLISEGDETNIASIIISGSALAYQEDYTGGFRNVIAELGPGATISTSSSILSIPHPLTVVTRDDVVYFSFSMKRLFSRNIIQIDHLIHFENNLLVQMSKTMSMLFEKITFLTQRTTRARLMSYLVAKSYENKSKCFTITLNRQQLADYLGVDRAAMTVVLSELMNDGYIVFNKNDFTLTQKTFDEI